MTSVVRVCHQPVERVLDQPFAFGVERARRFVEQQDRRIAQQRAGNGDALALAARKPRAVFAQEGVEPIGQFAQEASALAARAAAQICLVGRLPVAIAQVVARDRRRTARLPAAPAPCGGARRRDRPTVSGTPSSLIVPDLRIVKPLGQLEQGGLLPAPKDRRSPLSRPVRPSA
jgi:hypothetical protein